MISKELGKALSSQMVFEMYSSYVYLGLAAKLEKMKMPGAAHWLRVQTDEELIHANFFYVYLNNQDAEIELSAIAKPELSKVSSPLQAFETALKHEHIVTERINALAALSLKMNDFSSLNFMNFFLSEQVQEEKSVRDILDKFNLADGAKEGLLLLDSELASRPAASLPANPPV